MKRSLLEEAVLLFCFFVLYSILIYLASLGVSESVSMSMRCVCEGVSRFLKCIVWGKSVEFGMILVSYYDRVIYNKIS